MEQTQEKNNEAVQPSPTRAKLPFKERFFGGVVRHRRPIIAVFVLCALVCALLSQLVGVNYDMNDYLPADSPSTVALDTMEEQFDGVIPNARVMIEDVDIDQALAYKERFEAVEGVDSVTWLDDAGSMEVPLEMQDQDTVETYYKDGCALFSIAIENEHRLSAVSELRDIAGEKGHLAGSAVSTAVATESTVSQIQKAAFFAVLFVLLILIITTRSWIEPLIVLLGLGVAVLINNGTNLMFGTISFVTNAAGSILQIAIALDFCVFLLHRYAECRGRYGSPEQDMVQALCKTSTAIISSACTVMIGFLALTVMRFQIGPDLGFALAKGILISLVTVMVFMPGVFVCLDGLITKSTHRPFIPGMGGFARAVLACCIPMAVLLVLLPVPSFLASTSDEVNSYYGSSHIFNEQTELGADTARITEVFGQRDTYVLMVPKGDLGREAELSARLQELPQVKSVLSYVDAATPATPQEMVGESTLKQLQGSEYSRMALSVEAPYEGEEAFGLVGQVRAIAQELYPDTYLLAGEGVSTTDLMETITEDKEKVDFIAVAAVLLVLLLATRSLSLPVILVFVIETAIWLNFSVPYYTGQPVFYIAYLIVSTVQLGVTVDYAILMTDRYKEYRRELGKRESLRRTVESCTVAVSTSGIVLVVVGFLLSIISTHGILAQLGHFLGAGVLMSLVAVLFALPGFLYACDPLIGKTTLHARFCKEPKAAEGAAGTEA
ncbi:MAG: RND family transporter [Coriobacteriales bacterium]